MLDYVKVRIRSTLITLILVHLFLADQRAIVFPKSVRFEPPDVIEILKLLCEAKKCANPYQ